MDPFAPKPRVGGAPSEQAVVESRTTVPCNCGSVQLETDGAHVWPIHNGDEMHSATSCVLKNNAVWDAVESQSSIADNDSASVSDAPTSDDAPVVASDIVDPPTTAPEEAIDG